jgi:hypothetical protein
MNEKLEKHGMELESVLEEPDVLGCSLSNYVDS